MKVEITLTSFDSTLKSKSEKETSRQLLIEYIVVKNVEKVINFWQIEATNQSPRLFLRPSES